MATLENTSESKDGKAVDYKSWAYIVGFLIFFLLVGFLVKWFSAMSHGTH